MTYHDLTEFENLLEIITESAEDLDDSACKRMREYVLNLLDELEDADDKIEDLENENNDLRDTLYNTDDKLVDLENINIDLNTQLNTANLTIEYLEQKLAYV